MTLVEDRDFRMLRANGKRYALQPKAVLACEESNPTLSEPRTKVYMSRDVVIEIVMPLDEVLELIGWRTVEAMERANRQVATEQERDRERGPEKALVLAEDSARVA